MFLKLALENGYEADMDDRAVDSDMKKRLDEIRRQDGKKELPKAGQYRQSPRKETIQGSSTKATTPTATTRLGGARARRCVL